MLTRDDADDMALRFLAEEGPHTVPNPIDTEEAIGAMMIFIGLHDRGLINHVDHGGGRVVYSINAAGLARITCEGRA